MNFTRYLVIRDKRRSCFTKSLWY